jgi:hypothetical protein
MLGIGGGSPLEAAIYTTEANFVLPEDGAFLIGIHAPTNARLLPNGKNRPTVWEIPQNRGLSEIVVWS